MEVLPANPFEFGQAEFGKTPTGFDPVEVTSSPGKLIVMIMDAVRFVTFQNQAVVSTPTIGVDRAAFGGDLPLDHPHQFSLRAVHDGRTKDHSAFFVEPDHSYFFSCPPTAYSSDPPGAEVTFINLHTSRVGSRFFFGQCDNTSWQEAVDSTSGVLIQPTQIACSQGPNIGAPKLQNLTKLRLGKPCMGANICFSLSFNRLYDLMPINPRKTRG